MAWILISVYCDYFIFICVIGWLYLISIAIILLTKRNTLKLRKMRMVIIKAYEAGTLTKSQSQALYNKATELKAQGYTYMFVSVFTPVFSDTEVLSYTATDGEFTQQAYVGKKGSLSHGIGRNNKKGYKMELGNTLELTLQNLDKFDNVVTV